MREPSSSLWASRVVLVKKKHGSYWFCIDYRKLNNVTNIYPLQRINDTLDSLAGLCQFKVLPFGLCNAPSIAEQLMERILQGLRWEILLVYLDDIIIFSKSIAEHLERLDVVFSKLAESGLKLKPRKCHFFKREVVY